MNDQPIPIDEEEYPGQSLSVEIGRMNHPPAVRNTPAGRDYPKGWKDDFNLQTQEELEVRRRLQSMDAETQKAYALWCIENGRATVSRESLEEWTKS